MLEGYVLIQQFKVHGADIMKLVLIRLFKAFYQNDRTEDIRFKSMIHDEVNYQIRKDKLMDLLPEVMDIMRVKMPDWAFPMEVGLEIGNRWGQCVAFDFELESQGGKTSLLSGVKPTSDPIDKKLILNTFNIKEKVEEIIVESEKEEGKVVFDWEE